MAVNGKPADKQKEQYSNTSMGSAIHAGDKSTNLKPLTSRYLSAEGTLFLIPALWRIRRVAQEGSGQTNSGRRLS